jgi:hypothetical protein
MSTPYPTSITTISNGEAVNSTVTNRPINQLAARTDSVREKVDNGLFGTALIAFDVPVDSDSKVGMAVYVGSTGAYHKALAATLVDTDSNFQLAETSMACGIILRKNTATSADVILQGVGTIKQSDLTAVCLSGTLTMGQQIYLGGDNTKAGWVTQTRPLIHVPLGSVHGPNTDGTVTVVVAPAPRPDLHNHVHYRVPLTMVNAGNTTATAGWLNATSGNFPGKTIPSGAVYGYNINQDTILTPLWPPIPLHSVYLERNGKGIRTFGTSGQQTCIIDGAGIWWMDSCVTNQPFGKAAISDGSGCLTYPDRLDLWFAKINALTDVPIVTSLAPADNTIVITNSVGTNATTGPLLIKSVLPLQGTPSDAGYLALKDFTSSSGVATVKRGPVVAGVRSKNGAIVINGTTTLSAADPLDSTTQTFQTGFVDIDFAIPATNREGGMNMLVFDSVDIAVVNEVPHYSMRAGRISKIRSQLRVPALGITGSMSLTFKFMFYSGTNGQFPSLTLASRIVHPASSTCTNTALPTVDSALETMTFTSCSSVAGQYFEKATGTPLTVQAGDLVFLTISRASGDGYVGDVGILDIKWSLS